MRGKSKPQAGLLLILAAYLATSLWMVYRLPAFSGPNEELHYEHVALLRRDLRLPDAAGSTRMDERHQPPIYYLAAALAGWRHANPPMDTDFAGNPHYLGTHRGNLNPKIGADPDSVPLLYAARLASLAFGLLGLVATWWAVGLVVGRPTALLVTALLAFHPAWLHLGVTAANDLPVAAMCALGLAWATWLLRQVAPGEVPQPRADASSESRSGALLGDLQSLQSPGSLRSLHDPGGLGGFIWGAILSLAVLTKANAIFLALAWAPVCLWLWRWRGFGSALRAGLVSLAGFLPLLLGWIALNRARGLDATGVERSVPVDRILTLRPGDIVQIWPELPQIWRSVWLDWSRGDVGHAPDWVYLLIAAFLLVALVGWSLRRGGGRDSTMVAAVASMHLTWLIGFLAFYLAIKTLMVVELGFLTAEGRWILPLAPSVAWLTGVGLAGIWPAGRRRRLASLGLTCGTAIAGVVLSLWLVPRLHPKARLLEASAAISASARPVGIQYVDAEAEAHAAVASEGDLDTDPHAAIELEAALLPESVEVGRPADLQLLWQVRGAPPADYSVSTQLLAPEGEGGGWRKVDQQDSLPGLGGAPTSSWRAGQRWLDPVRLHPKSGAEDGPVLARLGVWLVTEGGSGPALTAIREGQPVAESGMPELVLRPAVPLELPRDARRPDPVRFGDAVELAGWRVEPMASPDAETWALTLYWQVESALDGDYHVFAQLLDADGQVVGQADGVPLGGQSPTSIWRSGDRLRDRRLFSALPGPGFSLLLGLYDPKSGARLEAIHDGQRLPNDAYRIEPVLP